MENSLDGSISGGIPNLTDVQHDVKPPDGFGVHVPNFATGQHPLAHLQAQLSHCQMMDPGSGMIHMNSSSLSPLAPASTSPNILTSNIPPTTIKSDYGLMAL